MSQIHLVDVLITVVELQSMEDQIRFDIFDWLKTRSVVNGGVFTRDELSYGYSFKGKTIHLMGASGIWIPKGFECPISITTTTKGPYNDGFREDGILQYSYRGKDPQHRENRGLRLACNRHIPLIYFISIKPSYYNAVWPIFILRDNPETLSVDAAIDISLDNPLGEYGNNEDIFSESALSVRRYITRQTKQRLHQSAFREHVLSAYDRQCTICRLQHPELLDAAHIIPDTELQGDPIVNNGLSLCKIHHSAYDQNILGISPDYTVHIRKDLLDEIDGPMLKHGFQELDLTNITLPSRKKDRPDRDRLADRFDRFRTA